jgi:hypothetical protein
MKERDFEVIAGAVRDAAEQHRKSFGDRWPLTGQSVVESIADACEHMPEFDRARFLTACEVAA